MKQVVAWWRDLPVKWQDRATNLAMFAATFAATVMIVGVLA